jgi:hypothetical protein
MDCTLINGFMRNWYVSKGEFIKKFPIDIYESYVFKEFHFFGNQLSQFSPAIREILN